MTVVRDAKPRQVIAPQGHAAGQLNGNFGPVHPQLPSYIPSYHTTPLLPPPPPPPPSYPKYPSAPATEHRQSPTKRFFNAFAVALLIYLAILSLAHTFFRMASGGIHWGDGPAVVPLAEDGRVLQSIGSLDWSSYQSRPRWAPNYSESAETSFILPIASDELYLISRGSYQNGNVQARQSTERGDNVQVHVRVAYHDEQALARTIVCRLQKSGSRDGVGIYTPASGWSHARDRLFFEVVFTFPAARTESFPLHVKAFTTYTSNFAHEIGDLWESMVFDHVELKSSNSPIHVNSITLTSGALTSSNGPITGHFNTSDSLTLQTSNAHIQATASLFDAGGSATRLDMRTNNGPIKSSVSLITERGSGGNFVVKSRSSNGAISLQYDDAPPGAHLVSDVRTSNSPASVTMHPAFEGTYEVSTSNGRPVVRDTHPVDPSGMGRRRIVHQTTHRNMISGTVYWAVRDEGARRGAEGGASTVHTSNARVSLDL